MLFSAIVSKIDRLQDFSDMETNGYQYSKHRCLACLQLHIVFIITHHSIKLDSTDAMHKDPVTPIPPQS
jgi:hypothetical protein